MKIMHLYTKQNMYLQKILFLIGNIHPLKYEKC